MVGCGHGCIYCKPSFQAQMKRQLHHCLKCYNYEPHAHLERLLKPPPKTEGDEFIFFPSSGDPFWSEPKEFQAAIDYTRKYHDRTFLIQSKGPSCFHPYEFPSNVILATTLETDKLTFDTPSNYQSYRKISHAPIPLMRANFMASVEHIRKIVTVEPILDFTHNLVDWIHAIAPQVVYVGYDNHHCRLPEPPLSKTKDLITELEKFAEVRVKTLRKAWWE